MCGISAFIINQNNITSSNKNNYLKLISDMNSIIKHRGPDDEGFVTFNQINKDPLVFGGNDTPKNVFESNCSYTPKNLINDYKFTDCNVALGHRRLSILDLSPLGHQPMSTDNKRYWISFNGEIYNFKELKKEMIEKGEIFNNNTDTEVILKYYIKYRENSFKNFHGMWSFIIFDNHKKELIVCRDRFGIKPLYYYISNLGNVYFASEIKQFTLIPEWQAKLNHNRAYDYIMYSQTDHTNETLFKNVYHCPAGHYIKIDINNIKFNDQYKLESISWYKLIRKKNIKENYSKVSSKLKQKISHSIKEHKISDVPISYCLSGGLDSSILVLEDYNLIQKKEKNISENLITFSVLSEDETINEKKWINEVIKNRKIVNKNIYPSLDNFFAELNHLIWVYDEPVCDSTIYSEWSVYKLISDNKIKVAISGQGADEMFGGYHNYFFTNLLYLIKNFNYYRLIKEIYYLHKIHKYSYYFIIKGIFSKILPSFFSKLYHYKNISHHDQLLKLHNLKITKPYNFELNYILDKFYTINDLNYYHIISTSLPKLLRYADRGSMINSVELRVPYLDHAIVEYVLNMPEKYKIYNGITKYILRYMFADILPIKIKNRIDKIGFETASVKWMLDDASEHFKKKLNLAIKNSKGIISEQSMIYFNQIIKREKPFDDVIYRLVFLSEWIEVYNVDI